MILVDFGSEAFCIDPHEVTNTEYAAFLAAAKTGDAVKQRPECAWNSDLVPIFTWPPDAEHGEYPVRNVDWCDADAYCAWAGKRLCRSTQGESIAWTEWTLHGPNFLPLASEWGFACSGNGAHVYSYGDEPSPSACQNKILSDNSPAPVGSMPDCVSASPGLEQLVDMSGNMAEWEDGCDGDFGDADNCLVRGGSYRDFPEDQKCLVPDFRPRANADFILGIRCCRDAE